MIVPSGSYKINKKTGDIIKRQVVKVKCDECSNVWESLYQTRKKRQLDKDYCKRCRYLLNSNLKYLGEVEKKRVACLNCKNIFHKKNGRDTKCCSLKCRDEYNSNKKYGHLFDTFKNNVNEAAYLFGLMLGDGHLRKVDQKNTTRVCIAFDVKHNDLIETFKEVVRVLEIDYFVEPKIHKNCQVIGFVLPDKLLERYEILYNGAKYDNHPKPADEVINNINFAAGLINSDGWCGFSQKKYKTITFTNTVFSIVEALTECLNYNDVLHKEYEYKGYFDKRTNKRNKSQKQIHILRQKEIDKFQCKLSYGIKKFKNKEL